MTIYVDERPFSVSAPSMIGAKIKGLVGRDHMYAIRQELGTHLEDRDIGDQESVCIQDGLRFYTHPIGYGITRAALRGEPSAASEPSELEKGGAS